MITDNMTDLELLKACKPMMVMDNWECLEALLRRRQAKQTKRAMSLVEPVEIYRSQGRVHALDGVLSLREEAKAL